MHLNAIRKVDAYAQQTEVDGTNLEDSRSLFGMHSEADAEVAYKLDKADMMLYDGE